MHILNWFSLMAPWVALLLAAPSFALPIPGHRIRRNRR
jgi:hypothetical protein